MSAQYVLLLYSYDRTEGSGGTTEEGTPDSPESESQPKKTKKECEYCSKGMAPEFSFTRASLLLPCYAYNTPPKAQNTNTTKLLLLSKQEAGGKKTEIGTLRVFWLLCITVPCTRVW